jgi:hypothetical protein
MRAERSPRLCIKAMHTTFIQNLIERYLSKAYIPKIQSHHTTPTNPTMCEENVVRAYALKIETNTTGSIRVTIVVKQEHTTAVANPPRVPHALATEVVTSINRGSIFRSEFRIALGRPCSTTVRQLFPKTMLSRGRVMPTAPPFPTWDTKV